MNILIVDDNKNNRMILRLLLEDYMEENEGVSFNLDEAEDGLIAVSKSKEKDFDIILMDIMMPNMDGIEATKIIRKDNQRVIIIAVSAVDDDERKKLILNNGAEDYISKPINSDLFNSRISNYIKLSHGRKNTRNNNQEINLFSKDIYSRHTKFIISSEDSLSEFWEFFLLNARTKYDNLSDIVRAIFSISDTQLRLSINSEIYVEESDYIQYFTVTNIDKLPANILTLLLKKNGINENYKIGDAKITFSLDKTTVEEDKDIDFSQKSDTIQTTVIEEEDEEIVSPLAFASSLELQVFDYIDDEDLNDLEEYAGKLNSIMLVVGSGGVTEDEVIDIYTYLDKIGSILSTYSEVYPIAMALTNLSVDMSSHMQEFIDNSEALGPMCKAFSNDMSKWVEQSFHTGAPSVDFMNDTIVVNCQTIASMLKMDEVPADGADDFDDIFDF